jgi:hypothetical protein
VEVGNVVVVVDPVRASTVEGAWAEDGACVLPQAEIAAVRHITVTNVRVVRLIGSPTLSRRIRVGASGHFGCHGADDENRRRFRRARAELGTRITMGTVRRIPTGMGWL